MTKKSQARQERDRTKAERVRIANLLGTHPDSRLVQGITTKLPASPMYSPAIAAARKAYLMTDPMLMMKDIAESFQGLAPGTPEHTAAAERAEAALVGMAKGEGFEPFADITKLPDEAIISSGPDQMKFHPYQEAAVRELETRASTEALTSNKEPS